MISRMISKVGVKRKDKGLVLTELRHRILENLRDSKRLLWIVASEAAVCRRSSK